MGAFRGAVVAGSHAIETDLHLSKDGVVVLSHVGRKLSTTRPACPPLIVGCGTRDPGRRNQCWKKLERGIRVYG